MFLIFIKKDAVGEAQKKIVLDVLPGCIDKRIRVNYINNLSLKV